MRHVGEIGLKTLDSRATRSNALQLSLFLLGPQGSSFERAEFKRRNANAVGDNNAAQHLVGTERRTSSLSGKVLLPKLSTLPVLETF
jgi:hypothetical protein